LWAEKWQNWQGVCRRQLCQKVIGDGGSRGVLPLISRSKSAVVANMAELSAMAKTGFIAKIANAQRAAKAAKAAQAARVFVQVMHRSRFLRCVGENPHLSPTSAPFAGLFADSPHP